MNKPVTSWAEGLKFEKSQMPRADKLYKHIYGQFEDFKSKRWKWKGTERLMQQADVDVTVEFDGQLKHISEKFRTSDFGDMYIELYTNVEPNKKLDDSKFGWGLRRTIADLIYYYTPNKIYCVQVKQLRKVINKLMDDILALHVINNCFENMPTPWVQGCYHFPGNSNVEIKVVKNYSDRSKSDNVTIGVCIPWKLLIESGVKVATITEMGHDKYHIQNFIEQ